MLEFTKEQVYIFLIGAILFTFLYMIIYYKKGQNKSLRGYIDAIRHCFTYAIMAIFIVIGWKIVKITIAQSAYMALLVPIGWLLIIYLILKRTLKTDFNLEISIIKLHPTKEQNIEEIIVPLGVSLIMLFFIILIGMAIFDTENQPYGPIPLIIVEIIFGAIALVPMRILYFKIVGEERKNKTKIKFKPKKIFYSIFILFGCLFLVVGIKRTIDYKEKEKLYTEVQGNYIGYQIRSNDDEEIEYYLMYSYEVNGKEYRVLTDYFYSVETKDFENSLPNHGDMETILYNPNQPSEAIVKKAIKVSVWFIFGGILFIIFTISIIIYKKKKLKKSSDVNLDGQ